MRLLRTAESRGELRGVHIPRGRPLLHRLFADDSGVAIAADEGNFNQLCRLVEKFERISGAQLNMAKSVIIPMALYRNPQWLVDSGCKILKEGLGLTSGGYKLLESMCRDFIWGKTAGGKTRRPLVVWDSITKPTKEGGLQIKPFQVVADTMKLKYIGRLLGGEDADWANIIKFFIRTAMTRSAHGQERRWWTPEEGLLLLDKIPSLNSSTARHEPGTCLEVGKKLGNASALMNEDGSCHKQSQSSSRSFS
ncbi:hypothetical protein R1sor_022876 [Riccia sorocarpa]|uniref:Reverse transcriptase domain-containing protein n=1 Tax=Riccia sorocarpa TaxID=122646 RepID=A0ABD3GL43_9MARC